MGGSLVFLSLALRDLPLGLSYAIWTGIGTVGTTAFGALALGEALDLRRALCLACVLAGVAGLRLTAPH